MKISGNSYATRVCVSDARLELLERGDAPAKRIPRHARTPGDDKRDSLRVVLDHRHAGEAQLVRGDADAAAVRAHCDKGNAEPFGAERGHAAGATVRDDDGREVADADAIVGGCQWSVREAARRTVIPFARSIRQSPADRRAGRCAHLGRERGGVCAGHSQFPGNGS